MIWAYLCNHFIFVAGPAQRWQAKSWVVVSPGDFPDSDETSDHRPVAGVVELSVRSIMIATNIFYLLPDYLI